MNDGPTYETSSISNMQKVSISGLFLMVISCAAAQNIQEKEEKITARECSPALDSRKRLANEISIVTAEQLLLKLREIHENFLLLDKSFINEKNLRTTFGLAKRYRQPLNFPEYLFFAIQPTRSALLRTDLHFSAAVLYQDNPRSRSSRMYIAPYQESNLYPADLVERTIAKDIAGRDFLGEAALGLSDARASHATENYILRGPALHPKGFFEYSNVIENEYCRSALGIDLNAAGEVLSIRIQQKEK